MAKAPGMTGGCNALYKRSLNYKNAFYRNDDIVRGRHTDGRWAESFHPDKREQYITEDLPGQYRFYVPHDVTGPAQLMSGRKRLEQSLDNLFQKNEYWHGNEPGHQIPFMYSYTAAPWKMKKVVRQILQTEYNDGAAGLSGNDISSIKLNGKSYSKNYIRHSDLIKGGRLEIYFQPSPSSGWGAAVKHQPPGPVR